MSDFWSKVRSALWPVLEQFASPAALVVLTPFLLHRLSVADFAMWLLAQSLLVAAPTLSVGRSIALMSILPRYKGLAQRAAAMQLVAESIQVIVRVSLGLLVIAIAINISGAYCGWWERLPTAAVILTVILLAASESESTLTSVMKAYRRFSYSAATELSGRALQVIAIFTFVSTGTSICTVLIISILTTVVKLIVRRHLVSDILVANKAVVTSPPTDYGNNLFNKTGFWSWINVISAVAFYSFDRWAVLAFSGSAALAAYSICQQMAQLSHAIPAAAAQLLVPWTAERTHSPARSQDQRNLVVTAFWCAAGAAVLPLLTLIFAPHLLAVWISPAFSVEHESLARRLALVFLLLSLNIPFFSMMVGMGHIRRTAWVTLVSSICSAASILVIAPSNLLLMADLKLIYAGIALVFCPLFLVSIKSLQRSTASAS